MVHETGPEHVVNEVAIVLTGTPSASNECPHPRGCAQWASQAGALRGQPL